jgi:O-antigen/teichoic acid export membrane protein
VDPLGLLNLAKRLAAIPASYLQILNQVALPAFSRLQSAPDDLLMRLRVVLQRVAVLCGRGFSVISWWLPDIIALVYGERWRTSGLLLQYLGVSIVLTAMASVIGPALNAMGRHWLRTIPMLAAYALVWGSASVLIARLDITGLGLAIVLFSVMQVIGLSVCLPYIPRLRAAVIRTVTATAGIACLVAMSLPFATDLGGAERVALSASGLLLACAILLAEKMSGDETTLSWLIRMIRSREG